MFNSKLFRHTLQGLDFSLQVTTSLRCTHRSVITSRMMGADSYETLQHAERKLALRGQSAFAPLWPFCCEHELQLSAKQWPHVKCTGSPELGERASFSPAFVTYQLPAQCVVVSLFKVGSLLQILVYTVN